MKLSLTMHKNTITIESDNDDADLEEMCALFKQLLLGAGFLFDGEVVIEEDNI